MQNASSQQRSVAIGVTAIFIAEFVSLLFANARNIAQPGMIAEFNGMSLFPWLIALPALSGAAGTLLFGKLSDMYGRRTMILLCILIFTIGLGINGSSGSMVALIAGATFMSFGHFPIYPLCFAVIGDLFPPEQRAKWMGLLALPVGIAALLGPVVGGLVTESSYGWRGLYWGTIPLNLLAAGLVAFALPQHTEPSTHKVDLLGTLVMVFATTTLILGFSWLGAPNTFWFGIGSLVLSVAGWLVFISVENKAEAPILDPHVLFNRTFATAAFAGLLSCFGLVAITGYSTIFVQQVMRINPTLSGTMLTPFSALNFMIGMPVGFYLARIKKYRSLIIFGYATVTATLLLMWGFTASTPIWLYMLVTTIAGIGLGIIPTVNTVVGQFSVPKRLLGVAVGAVFFFQMIGIAVSPAILGLAQNSVQGQEAGIKLVFLVSAIVLAIGLLLIITIPEIPLEATDDEVAMPEITTEGALS